jgi:serine/threonine protein kinase
VDGAPLGRYRLVGLFGRGSMGDVWRAHDTATNPMLAIKLPPPQLARENSAERRTNPPRILQDVRWTLQNVWESGHRKSAKLNRGHHE